MAVTLRGTLLLIGLLTALVAFQAFTRRPAGGGVAMAPGALLSVPPRSVTRVEIEERDWQLVAIRSHDGWRDTGGRALPSETVDDLLETLAGLRPVLVVEHEPERPGDYGLGPHAMTLRVVDGEGTQLALEVGERNPAWTGLYVREVGRPAVLLVGALLRWEIDKLRGRSRDA